MTSAHAAPADGPAARVAGLIKVYSGNVRALAVAAARRLPFLPDVPTMAEAGMAGFIADSWSGILAPAATPRPIVEYLGRELQAALKRPDIHERLTGMGFEVLATSEEAEVSKTARVVGEVAVGKQVGEREETVKDTVRRTEVEVEKVGAKERKPG